MKTGDILCIDTDFFEGKTIFHLLSYLIFSDEKFHEEINKIYEEKSHIDNTEKDKIYDYLLIFNYFSSIFKTKFILLRKEPIKSNGNEDNCNVVDIIGKEKEGNFVVIINEKEGENNNKIFYSTFKFRIGGISEKKIQEIQNTIFEIKTDIDKKDK